MKRFRGHSAIVAAVLWILVAVAALHRSRHPSVWGRYSPEWMLLLGSAVFIATLQTLAQLRVKTEQPTRSRRHGVIAYSLSLLLSLALLEAAMRLFNLLGSSFYTEIRRYSQMMVPDARLYYTNPMNFRGVFQDVEVATNELGLREPPLPPKSPYRGRILLLGDSVAFGWGVAADRVASRELKRQLESRRGLAVETLNSGVPGYNTLQEDLFLQTYADRLRPDVVLLLYVDNDTDYLDTSKPYVNRMPNPIENPVKAADYALSGSRVFFMARHFAPVLLSFVGPQEADETKTRGWRISMRSLAEIASYCRSRGIPFATFLYRLISTPHTDRLKTALSEAAQSEGFYFCDTLPWFSGRNFRRLVNSFVDSHPNANGHYIMGDGMAQFLLNHPELMPGPMRKTP